MAPNCNWLKNKKGPLRCQREPSTSQCRGGRIRTYGLVVPNDARYRAALHPESRPMGRPVSIFPIVAAEKSLRTQKSGGFKSGCSSVGVAGFEPTTSSTPCWRDTRLRYTPIGIGMTKVSGFSGLVQSAVKESFGNIPSAEWSTRAKSNRKLAVRVSHILRAAR